MMNEPLPEPPGSLDTHPPSIEKAPTGIPGLDEITYGGFPAGRPTLVCGTAGCGKTLLALEFLVRGVTDHGEPGVFVAFEERAHELAENCRSLGFDLDALVAEGRLVVDHIHLERSEIEETGEYDLEGLFLRLGYAIDSIGAKRVALDTIETLFSGLSNTSILRAELRRLFRWLKDRGVTAVVTAERGDGTFTRSGLEEYVSDCVILLDHRVVDQISTRRLRVVKYRGSAHGTNEYPFVIDRGGMSVLPITSVGLDHEVSEERISTGSAGLDEMLGGKGVYRGSSVLVSGTAGVGKTTIAAHFAAAACRRGERVMYFAFEESPRQILRNLRTIGLDLQPLVDRGLLRFHAERPTLTGIEMHLATIHREIQSFEPGLVVVDPITNFLASGQERDVEAMFLRLADLLKSRHITAVFNALVSGGSATETSTIGLSSLIDCWLLLRDIELGGERNRAIHVLKARGMAHSNQIREFRVTSTGLHFETVYTGPEGVLTGSMRVAQEEREAAAARAREEEARRRRRSIEQQRRVLEAQIASLQVDLAERDEELQRVERDERATADHLDAARRAMAERRGKSTATNGSVPPEGDS